MVDIGTVVNATESGTQQVTATLTDDDPVPPVITLLNENFDSMGSAGTTLPAAWTAGYLGTVGTQNRLAMTPYAGNGLGITAMPVVVNAGSASPVPTSGRSSTWDRRGIPTGLGRLPQDDSLRRPNHASRHREHQRRFLDHDQCELCG